MVILLKQHCWIKLLRVKWAHLLSTHNILDFQALEYKSVDNSDDTKLSFFELSEVRLYTVLGLIAALVFIALIQASCTIYKTSKKNKSNKV
ncbi:hypothetical protein DOY81_014975, partial [Sarcophaga bullata]